MNLHPENWNDKYAIKLYWIAYLRIEDHYVAEDLVQDTFLAAIEGVDRFNGDCKVRTWLIAILKNKIIDYLRGKYVQAGIEETIKKNTQLMFHNQPENPYQIYSKNEFMSKLEECLEAIPKMYADVFRLRVMDGLDNKTLCKRLKISQGNSWVILHRAKKCIRDYLLSN